MKIGLDLDECGCEFWEPWREWAGLPSLPVSSWHAYRDHGMSDEEFVDSLNAAAASGLFLDAKPIPGFIEAVRRFKAAGHSIHFFTARPLTPTVASHTLEWLDRHGVPYDSVCIGWDKTVASVDVFLDDKVQTVDKLRAAGIRAYVLDRGREDQAGHPFLVSSWKAFVNVVQRGSSLIVGLSGYANTGKDTAADLLVERHGFTKLAFADALRNTLERLDPYVPYRSKPDRPMYYVRLSGVVRSIGWEAAEDEDEIRLLLQRHGDALLDEFGKSLLADRLFADLPPGNFVIAGVRRLHEAVAVAEHGGFMVRIERPGYGPVNTHSTETELDNFPFDSVVHNDTSIEHFGGEIGVLAEEFAGRRVAA